MAIVLIGQPLICFDFEITKIEIMTCLSFEVTNSPNVGLITIFIYYKDIPTTGYEKIEYDSLKIRFNECVKIWSTYTDLSLG
jgi:hypothetical protein